jgi:cytidylate kinase
MNRIQKNPALAGAGEPSSVIITVDGPLASGRTTLANGLCKTFGFYQLDLDLVMARLAGEATRRKIGLNDEEALIDLAEGLAQGHSLLSADGRHAPALTGMDAVDASYNLLKLPSLGAQMIGHFNALASTRRDQEGSLIFPGLVAVGSSMGRVVFPDAELGLVLDAELAVRSRRLLRQHFDVLFPNGSYAPKDKREILARAQRKDSSVAQKFTEFLIQSDTSLTRHVSQDTWSLPMGDIQKRYPLVTDLPDVPEALKAEGQRFLLDTTAMGPDLVKTIALHLMAGRLPWLCTRKGQPMAELIKPVGAAPKQACPVPG